MEAGRSTFCQSLEQQLLKQKWVVGGPCWNVDKGLSWSRGGRSGSRTGAALEHSVDLSHMESAQAGKRALVPQRGSMDGAQEYGHAQQFQACMPESAAHLRLFPSHYGISFPAHRDSCPGSPTGVRLRRILQSTETYCFQ